MADICILPSIGKDSFGYMQAGNNTELMDMGSRLSIELSCPVIYPAIGSIDAFVCKCGVIFPTWAVRGKNWNELRLRHDKYR